MEVKELLITSILGSGGAVGLAFYFIKKYVDAKIKKADDESQRKQEIKIRRMEIDDKLHHAYGRCLFWLRYHVEKGVKPNGEISEAFQELQEAEEEKEAGQRNNSRAGKRLRRMNMDTVTVVMQGGIALLVILAAVYGWPLAIQATKKIKWDIAQKVIEKFVYAAEQYIKGQKKGNEKLVYAKEKIKEALKVFGITLDDEILTALIDGTVFEKLNKDKNVKA